MPNGYIKSKNGTPVELVDAYAREQLALKLDATQNVADAGKFLAVGDDGSVGLVDAPSGGEIVTDDHINSLIDAKNKVIQIVGLNSGTGYSSKYSVDELHMYSKNGAIFTHDGMMFSLYEYDSDQSIIFNTIVSSGDDLFCIFIKVNNDKTAEFTMEQIGDSVTDDHINNLIETKITQEYILNLLPKYDGGVA